MENFLKIVFVCSALLASGCANNQSKIESAEKSQTSALMKDSSAQKAKDAQSADLTQQIKIVAATPWTPQSVKVIGQLADLNLRLVGSTDTSDTALAAQAQKLLADAQNAATFAAMQKKVDDVLAAKAKSDETVKVTTTKLYAIDHGIALGLDNVNAFESKLWWIGGLIVAFFIFAVLCKVGVFTGTTAAEIAAKVP